ncbi:MAG: tRNA uridine-5-carboxymethylaminomethyl(34) synthesis GTPase MnmE [Acidihalobacter sp.]|uniref:tRNA uridine-5-carboxymethylaminomethyl(34) synthesis GTPase MnmE n=1 Tax=Acidihalobacter sp. TaxID=1872108 RepID=UPI00307EE8A1
MTADAMRAEAGGDTIAAVATPPGRGAIGVIRLSGRGAFAIAKALAGALPEPRCAGLRQLRDAAGDVIDEALVITFPGPASFTGEDVVELQGHGGPAVLALAMERVLQLGARPARPGEFSERAFVNGRMDLAQAEAVADLIAAASRRAAQSAVRSLRGEFSRRVESLVDQLTQLRAHLEADFDFSDDDLDPFEGRQLVAGLERVAANLAEVLAAARQGERLNSGYTVVLAGAPNVGKSSLLNRLADNEIAIVTPIPGTTRDLLRADIELDGLAVEILDTAGLRDTDDPVEREGVRRALAAIAGADLLVRVYDDAYPEQVAELPDGALAEEIPNLAIYNKVDLSGGRAGERDSGVYGVSALNGAGIDELRAALTAALGYHPGAESPFLARERHVAALASAQRSVAAAMELATAGEGAELVAEELRAAQNLLGEITGRVTSDDLLGVIFSTFCIGK